MLVRYGMALVDQDDINVANLVGQITHRLDTGKRDLIHFFDAHASAVDAQRGVRPVLAHLLGILFN